ncbi:hypothetical protein NMY22_g12424 [Coprinellus aureogranulatus]|nr:hypothetical protein NMY22_g12424 [Coprinellus aureogranulatus]
MRILEQGRQARSDAAVIPRRYHPTLVHSPQPTRTLSHDAPPSSGDELQDSPSPSLRITMRRSKASAFLPGDQGWQLQSSDTNGQPVSAQPPSNSLFEGSSVSLFHPYELAKDCYQNLVQPSEVATGPSFPHYSYAGLGLIQSFGTHIPLPDTAPIMNSSIIQSERHFNGNSLDEAYLASCRFLQHNPDGPLSPNIESLHRLEQSPGEGLTKFEFRQMMRRSTFVNEDTAS